MIEIVPDMPAADYHAIKAVSASLLSRFHRSPAHSQVPVKETAAMAFGTAFHCALLEPERYAAEYVQEELDGRTKAGKARKAELELSGKCLLSTYDADAIDAMYANVRAMKTVTGDAETIGLLETGRPEVSVFWDQPVHGGETIPAKARLDWSCFERGIIVDVKTTKDASDTEFGWTARKLLYDMKAAWYVDGMKCVMGGEWPFSWLVVETEPPYGVACYEADEDTLAAGRELYHRLLPEYHHCLITGNWPGYPDRMQTLKVPRRY